MHGDGPWYLRPPVRLAFLLAVLAGVAAYGVPRIIRNVEGTSGAHGCSVGVPPRAAKLTPAQLEQAIDTSRVDQLIGAGFPDVEGLAEPTEAWTDSNESVLPSGAAVDGGYEIFWWSPQYDHQGVALFVFGNAAQASAYVRQAASTRCRRLATAYPTPGLPGGRGLVWINPVNVFQGDVFFARGNKAYRLTEVAPGSDPASRRLVKNAQRLACELPAAGCRPRARARQRGDIGRAAVLGGSFPRGAGRVWPGLSRVRRQCLTPGRATPVPDRVLRPTGLPLRPRGNNPGMPAICPRCSGLLEQSSRLCAHCGTPLDADGTLEMLPDEPSEDALRLLSGRPIEYPPTVHQIRRWPFRLLDSLRWRRNRVHRERAAAHLSRLVSSDD